MRARALWRDVPIPPFSLALVVEGAELSSKVDELGSR
jgi:hypothetical protein